MHSLVNFKEFPNSVASPKRVHAPNLANSRIPICLWKVIKIFALTFADNFALDCWILMSWCGIEINANSCAKFLQHDSLTAKRAVTLRDTKKRTTKAKTTYTWRLTMNKRKRGAPTLQQFFFVLFLLCCPVVRSFVILLFRNEQQQPVEHVATCLLGYAVCCGCCWLNYN